MWSLLRPCLCAAASDWSAWGARSWQVFGRGTPVWPCADLVIHLLGAVGSVCGTPKNMPSHLTKNYSHAFNVICIRTPQRRLTLEHTAPSVHLFNHNMHCSNSWHVSWNRSECCLPLSTDIWFPLLLQPLPKWPGPVGAAYWRLARLVVKVEQPCPSRTAVPNQSDQDIPIMSRLELKFAGWDQIFGSLVEKVHSLTPVNTGLSGP